jgi:hypothetical protein
VLIGLPAEGEEPSFDRGSAAPLERLRMAWKKFLPRAIVAGMSARVASMKASPESQGLVEARAHIPNEPRESFKINSWNDWKGERDGSPFHAPGRSRRAYVGSRRDAPDTP